MTNTIARRGVLVPAGLAAAVAAGALAFALIGSGSSATASPSPTTTISASLTSYQGGELDGFSVDKVPGGWDVLAADAGKLVLAPRDAADQDPNEFTGKILVTVANEAELSTERKSAEPLTIGDVTATLFVFRGGSTGLLVPADDRTLIFQFPDNLDWDPATIAEFAAGVRSTGTPEIAEG